MPCHKNHSARSAICVVRLSTLFSISNTRVLSPALLKFITICVILLERYAAIITRVALPVAKFLAFPCTPASPFKALVPILSLTYLFHSFPCNITRCKLCVATHLMLLTVRVIIFRKVSMFLYGKWPVNSPTKWNPCGQHFGQHWNWKFKQCRYLHLRNSKKYLYLLHNL